ncbi:MAG: hypothetical protein LBN74_09450 [Prevotella sp.]|nr:hypothetical protein [Prevotella sp.]
MKNSYKLAPLCPPKGGIRPPISPRGGIREATKSRVSFYPPLGGTKGGILLITFCFLLLTSCKTHTVYVPVETVKTEYKDKVSRDSVRLYDSVFVLIKGDTVRLEKYKYLYRDKLIRDSIFRSDTIRVPYPVVETKEVNRLTSLQSFQLWCGRILLLLAIGYMGVKYLRRKIKVIKGK